MSGPADLVLHDDEIVLISDSLLVALGYERDHVIHRSILEFVDEECRIELRERIRQREVGKFSTRFRHRAGDAIRLIGEVSLRRVDGRELREVVINSVDKAPLTPDQTEVLENKLRIMRQAVVQKEAALQELLHELKNQRQLITSEIRRNIERVALPVVHRLQRQADSDTQLLIRRLEETLAEIATPFVGALERRMAGLSPREVEICHMIKNGYSTKEIATALAISPQTVSVHRKVIRRKLGLTGSETNLISFLRGIDGET